MLQANTHHVQNGKFYQQTVEAMEAKQAGRAHSEMDDEGLFQKLKAPKLAPEDRQAIAVERQKYESPLKMTPGDGDGGDGGGVGAESEEKSIAGRKKMPVPSSVARYSAITSQKEEDAVVEEELNAILKRSPIIIFSKSFCPYSFKAKSIILNMYRIVPAPFVVELDMHPLGSELQQILAGNTGRSTVPNVLVNGMTIGGGDEIEGLHARNELAGKIQTLGGKRVMEISLARV
ncbi:uncharacterized protein PADG_02328 [Paracoccidioides brasiliensis Pb18]|uniref:Glutaredoxin domain-containing protein n=1 Tax=Paracoccidioides brasiliensis (strain Pb18) TaxID=502780 RepID=C1G2G2_PARBD|nr:uncharacterized protein PADG_02328 [Paracoccidioides brasiliensis Pb18]EEH46178.1 hypothetical protein PADG_02328 [Paracoccidioides brasiliensis Pb18]